MRHSDETFTGFLILTTSKVPQRFSHHVYLETFPFVRAAETHQVRDVSLYGHALPQSLLRIAVDFQEWSLPERRDFGKKNSLLSIFQWVTQGLRISIHTWLQLVLPLFDGIPIILKINFPVVEEESYWLCQSFYIEVHEFVFGRHGSKALKTSNTLQACLYYSSISAHDAFLTNSQLRNATDKLIR